MVEIEPRLLTVMPLESTIDRPLHALAVAPVILKQEGTEEIAEARMRAGGRTDEFHQVGDEVEAGRENSQQEHER